MRIFATFKTRMALVFGLAMLFIGSLVSIYLDQIFSEKLRSDRLQALHSLSSSVSAVLSENLRERQREISLLAQEPYLQTGRINPRQLTEVFDRLKRSYPYYAWIGYADVSGVVIASTNNVLAKSDVSSRPWFVQGKKGAYVGDLHEAVMLSKALPYAADDGPMRLIDFAAPVYDASGRLRGVLAAHAHWAWANNVTRSLRTNPFAKNEIQAFIVGKNGNIIYSSDTGPLEKVPANVLLAPFSTESWGGAQSFGSAFTAVVDPNPTSDLEWKVVTRQPLESMLKDVSDLKRTLLIAFLSAGGLLMVLIAWFASRLSRPIEQLSRFAQRIEAGDESAELEMVGQTFEIQQTAASVQKIARILLERKQLLSQANQELELKVGQRTAALQVYQADLESQRNLMRSVIDAVPYGLAVYDEQQVLQQCNASFFLILQIPNHLIEIGKTSFADVAHIFFERGDYGTARSFETVIQPFLDAMRNREPLHLERQQADSTYIEMRAIPVANDWIVMTYLDVTDRQQERKALEDSKTRLMLANESAGVGIWDFDLQTGKVIWDDQIYPLFGYEVGGVQPDYALWSNALHPDDKERVEAQFSQCLKTGEDFDSEFRLFWPDGTMHHLRGFGRCRRDAAGKIVSIIGTNFDVTPIRHAAQELSAALAKAEEGNLSKGAFLANMSHEIRTPLAAVLGLLQVLSQTPLTESQFDYVVKIESAAKSLLGLLNDILDFSKIEAGKLDIEYQPFQLDQLLRDLSVLLAAYVGSKPIEVLYDIDAALPRAVISDQLRLRQILVNLAGNAIKFTQSGQVVISAKVLEDTANPASAHRVEFCVSDSGIGIAPENISKLFNSFSQAETSTTRKFGGTGLGLAICKRLVDMMGGEIQVESELGVGTKFRFVLPMQTIEGKGDAESQLPVNGRTAHKVLLVDDNAFASALISQTMQSFGWTVDVAHSYSEAIERIQPVLAQSAPPYSLVYLDWQLKDIDGWDTLNSIYRLWESSPLPQPKYIMLSANGRDNLGLRTQEEQSLLSALLVKPVTPSMLFNAALRSSDDSHTVRRTQRTNVRELSGLKILVVEDNAINQQVAEELLSSKGASVSIAANGLEGTRAIAGANPQYDIVLMDIQMPLMDGYAATEFVRQTLRMDMQQLPIVGLTANAMSTDRDKCLQAGMNDHLGKPFDLGQLVSMVIRLTGKAARKTLANEPVPPQEVAIEVEKHLQQRTQSAPELDLASALRRLGGMQSLYVRSAKDFVKAIPQYIAKLHDAVETNDIKAALERIHAMKGISGTLGLNRLASQLLELESQLKAQNELSVLIHQLPKISELAQTGINSLNATISQLSEIGSATEIVVAAKTRDAAVKIALAELMPLLEASDLSALETFAKVRGSLEALGEPIFSSLEEEIQALEFDKALAICRGISH